MTVWRTHTGTRAFALFKLFCSLFMTLFFSKCFFFPTNTNIICICWSTYQRYKKEQHYTQMAMSRVAYTQRWPAKEFASPVRQQPCCLFYTFWNLHSITVYYGRVARCCGIVQVLNFMNEIAFKWIAKVNEMKFQCVPMILNDLLKVNFKQIC